MKDNNLRNAYANRAISQIPRILTHMDRNKYSPTYGCMHRDFWLYKTSDFPDAVRQFGVHALALVYRYDFPDNIYKGSEKIKNWTIAAMDYWTSIQHKEGSFDEFYPYERGWVGPTAFTSYTIIESYKLLKSEIPEEVDKRIREAVKKAAYFIAKGESEEDHLANHHAMACLALWKAYEMLNDDYLKEAFEKAFQTFLTYHFEDEGWSREYDGVDPGYLSATVSFFGKVYQTNKDPRIFNVLKESVNFSSYFVYPNGFYAGSAGSRNTLHFYCHGYEILSKEIPLAASIADKMLEGLKEGKLVPPEIMSDRYLFYRVPEFLLAYHDYQKRGNDIPPLPYEKAGLHEYFKRAQVFVKADNEHYIIANLAKGGVIKIFDKINNELIYNDCGVIGSLSDGRIVTSQWIDDKKKTNTDNKTYFEVEGYLNQVPSNKLFTLFKNLVFRTALLVMGWNPTFAHYLKGRIRKTLILGQRSIPVKFIRRFEMDKGFRLKDKLINEGKVQFGKLSFGDEFFVRYVPQSRFFQSQELEVSGIDIEPEDINKLNNEGELVLETLIEK